MALPDTLHEIVAAAREKLGRQQWDYLIGGSDTETTVARNRQAIDALAFRPRVLCGLEEIDCGIELFGRRVALPVALAPVGSLGSFDEGGVAAAARAAARFGTAVFCGSIAPGGMAAVAAATQGPKIYQAYRRGGDEPELAGLADEARNLGYDALCLTVDVAYPSRRERDIVNGYVKPYQRGSSAGGQAALSWSTVRAYLDRGSLPLVLKGIATAEDAAIAAEMGAAVVYVSNHGGRQLDHGRGTLEILPEIVAAVGGRAQVWVDGGVCRGADIVKCVALGADLVGIGRLYCYGLAAGGEDGVVRVLELLHEEVTAALALCGVDGFAKLSSAYVAPAVPVAAPHVLSAFPLLAPEQAAR